MATPRTTTNSAAGWRPDVQGVPIADAIPDLLLSRVTTLAGTVEGDEPAVRVPWVDDALASVVAEGAEIDESIPTLSEVVVKTSKVAQLLRISRELYGQQSAASLLSGSVSRAITMKANQILINGDTDASVTGLLDTPNIQTTDPVGADLDGLVDLIASIEADGGTATHLVVAPSAWASLRKMKTGEGAATSLLGAGTEDAARMLLGLPVLTTPALAPGAGLVVDKTAIMSASGQVMVAVSEDAYFSSDSIGLRATVRFGSVAAKGTRIGKFAVTE